MSEHKPGAEGDNSEYVKEKRSEFSRERTKYQFLWLLSQFILNSVEPSYAKIQDAINGKKTCNFNRDLADVLGTGNSKLCSDTEKDKTLFNIHHIMPLELSGTNDFSNLCLIHTQLHNFIHHYCFSRDVLRMLKNPTASDRKVDVTRFIPVLSPVARIADSFRSAIICAIRSACYFHVKNKRSNKVANRPISADVVRAEFDESTLRFARFNDAAFFSLVNLYKEFYEATEEGKKVELHCRINVLEPKIATSCMPETNILTIRRLWLDKFGTYSLKDWEGLDLIKKGALPRQVSMARTQEDRAALRKMLDERQRN